MHVAHGTESHREVLLVIVVEVEALCQVGDMCFVVPCLGNMVKELLHIGIELLLPCLNNDRIVDSFLKQVLLHLVAEVLIASLPLLELGAGGVRCLAIWGLLVEVVVQVHAVVVVILNMVLCISEHLDEQATEMDGAHVDAVDDLEKFLVREQALLEALVQEVRVVEHNIVDGLAGFELSFQLAHVWFKHLDLYEVHVILTELEHAVTERICLLEEALDLMLFVLLMLQPELLQELFSIFALKQVSENELVFVDSLLRNDQG